MRVSFFTLLLAITVPLCASTLGSSASAQDDIAELKARFRDALLLEEENKWQEALTIFEAIAEKKRSPQVVFHLALCQENTGRLKSAVESYDEAVALASADPKGAAEVLENAPGRAEALRSQVPRIVLFTTDGETRTVVLDGKALPPVEDETEIAVDPGEHRLAVRDDSGSDVPLRTVNLTKGQRLRINLPKRAKAEVVGPGKPSEPEPEIERGNVVPGFVVGGVGVAGLLASGVFIGLRQAAIGEVRDGCSGDDTGCDPALADVAERGKTYEYAAWGAGAAGLACVGVGAVLLLTVGQDSVPKTKTKAKSAVSTRLWIAPTGATLTGVFE